MTIVLPILFMAVAVGLFVPRVTPRVWFGLVLWICLVIAVNYFKN